MQSSNRCFGAGKSRTLAVGLLLVLRGVNLCAQSPRPVPASESSTQQTQVQIDNAESTSKPDDVQVPEANPARPTITNPAHIPPVGYLQFEQGFLQANGSPSGVSRQFSLNEVIRLSLHPRLMVEFATQPFANSAVFPSDGGSSSAQNDPGDLQLGLQGVLFKEDGRLPAVAVGYLHRVRAGSAPDLDIGSFSQSALVLLSGDLENFHYDVNFVVSEQSSDSVRRAQYGQTASVTHDVFPEKFHDKLELTGELWHFTQPLVSSSRDGVDIPRSHSVGTLWTIGYAVLPNLVIDGGWEHGLTTTSTAWQTFAGFTYLLPHRLWPYSAVKAPEGSKKHVHRR